jgi:hypothetical protein
MIFTAARQTPTKWLMIGELHKFAWMAVRAHGLEALGLGFSVLVRNMRRLIKNSGRHFAASYFKECQRIMNKWLARDLTGVTDVISVRCSRRGLPLLIPGELRRLILERGDGVSRLVFKAVVTILSVYRVMGLRPIRKVGSIIDPFTGSCQTLPARELRRVIALLPRVKPKLSAGWHFSRSAGPSLNNATLGCV